MEGERRGIKALEAQRASLQDLEEIVLRFTLAFPQAETQLFLLEDGRDAWRLASHTVGQGVQQEEPPREPPEELMKQALQGDGPLLADQEDRPLAAELAQGNTAAQALIPVMAGSRRAGLLVARQYGPEPLTPYSISYLHTIASHLGVTLHTQQLIDAAWQRTREIETVHGVTQKARELKPLEPTLAEIRAEIQRTFDTPIFYVALFEREKGQITFPFAVDGSRKLEVEPLAVTHDESLAAWVIRHGRPFITGDWSNESPVAGIRLSEALPSTVLCFPLWADGEIVGAISLQSYLPRAFDDHEINLLSAIADHVAVIVQNSRIYSTTQELVDNMAREFFMASALRQAVSAMGASLDLDLVLERFLASVQELLQFDSASLLMVHDGAFSFYKHIAYDGMDEQAIIDWANQHLVDSPLLMRVLQLQEPVVIGDVRESDEWRGLQPLDYVRSWAAVPLLVAREVVGILTLDSVEPNAFKQREVWVITTLAAQASLAIQNARLHNEIQSQVHELTTLYEAGAAINAELDRDTVLQTVVLEMIRALDLKSCIIFLPQPDGQLRVATGMRSPAGDAAHDAAWIDLSAADDYLALDAPAAVQRAFMQGGPIALRQGASLASDERTLLDYSGVESALLLPFGHGDYNVGLLLLGRSARLTEFTVRDIRLARNLAGQAGAAIEHARLYAQAKRRIDELSTFHQIVLQLNTPLELEVVLENITEAALKIIEANNLHIYLWDAEKDEFSFCSALWRNGSRRPAVASPRKDGLTASVVHSGAPVIIDNANSHPLFTRDEAKGWGVQAIAGFPLKHSDRVIGAFTVTYVEPHIFTPDEKLLMNLLADQAAIAVENARLFSDAQGRLLSMSALVDMAKQVTGNLRVELVLQTTVQTLQKLLRARASTIALISDDGEDLVVEAAAGIKPQFHRVRIKLGEGVSGRAVDERRMIYIRDTYREPDFLFFDDVLRSLLVVPLLSRDQVIGTLTVDSDRPHAFSESDTQLLTIAAAQVSVAIANARLFEALEDRAAELAVAYEELKENDRLKDELVQNVSHELRTPLTFIRGYVDLLVDGEMGELAPEQLRALRIVADKTGEVTRLVEDIMSLQRIDSANLLRQPFAMETMLESVVDLHLLSAKDRGLELRFRTPASRGVVEADRGRINQVLDNLIGNAMKFSPDGGTIELRMVDRKNDVLVVVSDEGIGVPPEKSDRIFDRFYQIDGSSRRRFGGAGIGLAIVRRIVEAHSGDIWIKSEVGLGSSFYFTIPKQEPSLLSF